MPELPEMENYRMLLQQHIAGQRISKIKINREKSINIPIATFIKQVKDQEVVSIERRAKYLVFHLQNGYRLLLHLMLGGWMFYGSEAEKPDQKAQIQLSFDTDQQHLYFLGLRLGYLHLLTIEEVEGEFADIGPEPFSGSFSQDFFFSQLKNKNGKLKAVLLDQGFVAGIGNRYSDEILWQAQLKPQRKASGLDVKEASALYQSIKFILQQAIESGGYMDNPFDAGDHKTGGYKEKLKVHGRQGKPCPRCQTPIIEEKIASRRTSYCPVCQH